MSRLSREIDDLKSQFLGLGRIMNWSLIDRKSDALIVYQKELSALHELNDSNNRLHAENPDIPSWSHAGVSSKAIPRMDMYRLYRELRGFDLIAGSGALWSPGHDIASKELSNRLLQEQDRDVLREYFSAYLFHDGKDHEPDSAYWELHRRLDAVISKLPRLEKPVTVWRGESYFPRRPWGSDRAPTLKKIQDITSLQPGDKVRWDQCAATSTSLSIAACSHFSHPVGKRGQPIRHNFDRFDPSAEPSYSVVFEMETDRGVFIDNDLHRMGQQDESEILLPMGMEYEVVGHAQIAMHDLGMRDDSDAHHVIKLRLPS